MSEEKHSVVLDLQEHFNKIHSAYEGSKEFFKLVEDVRRADRNLDKNIANILRSVQVILETLKVNQNTLVDSWETNGSKYEIYINNKGLRTKYSYYTNTDNIKVDDFKERFNAELLDKVFKAIKPFQQERLQLLMDMKDEFNCLKDLSTTQKELILEEFNLVHFDGRDFSTELMNEIKLPDVATKRGWHGELSKYQLLQMETFLMPELKKYQQEHQAKMDGLIALNAKIKQAYPLLFMFNGGLSGE